jgi:hypothetical protein
MAVIPLPGTFNVKVPSLVDRVETNGLARARGS